MVGAGGLYAHVTGGRIGGRRRSRRGGRVGVYALERERVRAPAQGRADALAGLYGRRRGICAGAGAGTCVTGAVSRARLERAGHAGARTHARAIYRYFSGSQSGFTL